ncbi:MAG: DUF2975 domain-containing protein [Erythrobacter sp.]
MQDKPNDLLLLAGQVIAIFVQIVMGIAAAVLVIVVPLFFLFRDEVTAEIAAESAAAAEAFPVMPTAGLLLIALAVVALVFLFFQRLRAIIATVGEGDPFAPENADRLNLMAWLLLGVQILMIPASALGLLVAKWADEVENADITIDAGLDLTGILMIIILFILARVFKHGAAMRADLEGTV